MKKKWLSVVALCMCFSMGMSTLASCAGGNTDSAPDNGSNSQTSEQGGNGGGNQDEQPMAKEAIYEAVMQAIDATNAYKGSFTMDGDIKDTRSSATVKMSVDTTNKVYFYSNEYTGSYGGEEYSGTMADKIFKQADTYYLYSAYDEVAAYYRLNAAQVDDKLDNSSMEGIAEGISFLPKQVASVDAFNAAFAEVFADSKAAQAAAGSEADGSFAITCTDTGDVYTVAMVLSMEVDIGEMDALGISMDMKMSAEGGYITEVVSKQVISITRGEETIEESSEMSYKISYTFDQAGYDAIEVTLPSDVQDKEEETYYKKSLDVVINGATAKNTWMSGETMQDAVASFLDNDWEYEGMNVTWYTDEACTKVLTADITENEMAALETLYGKATLKDGYAFVITEKTTVCAEDVSDAYKLVFTTLDMLEVGVSKSIEAVYGAFNVEERTGGVTVNGETVEFTAEDEGRKSMTATAGETYVVKYTKTYTKADLNIFATLLEEMM
jgi:hypothetical protein